MIMSKDISRLENIVMCLNKMGAPERKRTMEYLASRYKTPVEKQGINAQLIQLLKEARKSKEWGSKQKVKALEIVIGLI